MELISTRVCMTKDIGVNGNLFGGYMMSYVDEAAFAYACKYCFTERMVTGSVTEFRFQKPVKEGNIFMIYGEVVDLGVKSIEIHILVKKLDVVTEVEEIVTSTNIKFVKIDENGNSVPISDRVKEKFFLSRK